MFFLFVLMLGLALVVSSFWLPGVDRIETSSSDLDEDSGAFESRRWDSFEELRDEVYNYYPDSAIEDARNEGELRDALFELNGDLDCDF